MFRSRTRSASPRQQNSRPFSPSCSWSSRSCKCIGPAAVFTWSQRSRVSLADVTAYGWISGPATSAAFKAITDIFARNNLAAPRVVMEVPFASELNLSVLAATDLVTLVPRSFMRHADDSRFAVLPVPALRVPRAVVLLSRPGSSWSPLMQALRDSLLALKAASA